MTKINIYCLFQSDGALYGVYSSIKAVHRDALKLCNTGATGVYIKHPDGYRNRHDTVAKHVQRRMDVR